MKKLVLLLVSALLLSGLALAQSHDDHDRAAMATPQDQHGWNNDHREGARDERITNGPVVENLGDRWATIAWSTNTGGSSIVHYGTDPNRLSLMAESPYANDTGRPGETHRVKLDHLRPGTTYYYIVDSGQGQGTGTEAHSHVEQFTTRR
jgi:hypothetical protein